MSLSDKITHAYFADLVASPFGRAHVLNQCADAEASDEGAIFDHLLEQIDDADLRRLVRRHHDDEIRHAEMFRDCIGRTGVTPSEIPDDLKLLVRIDQKLGGMMSKPVKGRNDVMESYLLLQVIEERASTQFPMFERFIRPLDPKTADVYASIAKDEMRHLKYCRAVARKYAPDAATHRKTLQRMREAELSSMAEHAAANMRYVLAQGWIDAPPLRLMAWRGISIVASLIAKGQKTPYWNELSDLDASDAELTTLSHAA